jgi:hypothetical protein
MHSLRPRRVVAWLGALAALLLAAGLAGLGGQSERPRHTLRISLAPATHRLTVTDRVRLPPGRREPVEFLLNGRLTIAQSTPAVDEVPLGDVTPFFSINAGGAPGRVPLKRYRLRSTPADGILTLDYAGAMDFGLSDQKEEYTRGFRDTPGVVSPLGVYLAGGSFWYPHLGSGLLEFEMDVSAPAGWHVISQGSGASGDPKGAARWTSDAAIDEIHLVGGPLTVYRDKAGAVETLVYLHDNDEALAAKYLTTTAQYLEMYGRLIGPYPYDKFALVENFWETGYGMPSFTLLGREIIRFPFILHSSYPHEILHNWWGNSVFVDYASGNWAEGLTAYLADHLVQEQRRKGADHRRAALQKYRDYVKQARDFPLTGFRSRDSAATEAVGYGKTLMTFHMLRRRIGDERFTKMLAGLYRGHQGRRASWGDVQRAGEAAAGASLADFFDEWLSRAGAPALSVRLAGVRHTDRGYVVSGAITQTQGGRPYHLDVPVIVQTAAGFARHQVAVGDAAGAFELTSADPPLALYVDPYFDVFRRLDPRETPPSIGQMFGEPRIVAVLPAKAPRAMLDAYRGLLHAWQTPTHAIDVALDSEMKELPRDVSLWLLGRDNRFAPALFAAQAGVALDGPAWRIDGQALPLANHTAALIARHPSRPDQVVGWIVADPPAALPGLARKLPHYGRYSYVAFEGAEPANTMSGEWREADSPMRIDLRAPADRGALPLPPLPPDSAKALADLPPVFSHTTMTDTVARLAAPDMEGRGVGTTGLAHAAAFVADRFKAYGLAPGGDGGTYFQKFTIPNGPDGQPHELVNVVAYLPGARTDRATQSALVTAHYDHLGRGWPDVHRGDEGRIHPGADDNASGVAVMLELARALAASEKPSRPIVFVAFSGEEAGLAGSRHYADTGSPFPVEGIIGVINLDTVGRLFDQRVSVLGTGTATEWQHIFRGASFVTGVESRNIPESLQSSDQVPFVERGVPAVQIFTGAHGDYHRPGDTPDKIDYAGLVKVATLVREGVAYLAERPERLTVTIPSAAPSRPAAGPPGDPAARRVSFGTVPDFAFPGPGVRAEGVVEASPAAKAGVVAGDVILRVDGKPIANLQEFSNLLRTLSAGQTVSVDVRRGNKELTLKVTLVER